MLISFFFTHLRKSDIKPSFGVNIKVFFTTIWIFSLNFHPYSSDYNDNLQSLTVSLICILLIGGRTTKRVVEPQ